MSGKHRKPDVNAAIPQARLPEPPTAPIAVPAATQVVVPRRSRAEERARRRRAARRRALLGLAVIAGLLAVGGAVTWLLGRGDAPAGAGPGGAGPDDRQRTLLLQLTDAGGNAIGNAIIASTADGKHAASVLVPSGLLVDVAGGGTVPLAETTQLGRSTAGAEALTDLIGVRIDATWQLDAGALSALVDAVGPVRVSVDADVTAENADGDRVVVVRAGTQQLRGRQASAYAAFLADGEPEQARLARLDKVLTALLGALPAQPAAITTLLGSLGSGSQSSAGDEALARRLAVLHTAVVGQSLVADVLPVNEIDTGGETRAYGINSGEVAALVTARFPGAIQASPGAGVVRVLVENGVGTPGLVGQARTKLVDAGFRFVDGGNAAQFTDEPSSVIIPDGTEASVTRGEQVAAALGLPESAIAVSDRGQTVADVIVILGSDFRP